MRLNTKHTRTVLITCYIVSISLLAPYVVKLAHVFENHKHEVCIDYQKTHFHEFDIDCEFYKFKLKTQFSYDLSQEDMVEEQKINEIVDSQYEFIHSFQSLQIALRGPPILV